MDTNFRGLGKKQKFVDCCIRGLNVSSIHINENLLFVENHEKWYPTNKSTFTVFQYINEKIECQVGINIRNFTAFNKNYNMTAYETTTLIDFRL